jgi:hypothetical protein
MINGAEAVRSSVTVAFHGAREGDAPLTWGQRLMWRAAHLMGDSESFLNCPFVLPVYGRQDLDTIVGALRALLERHESLRTTFVDTPDGPVQRVARDGDLAAGLTQAGDDLPLRVAQRVSAELRRKAFVHAVDLPIACTIVLKGDRPRALALNFSHLAVDYQALHHLALEWRALLRGEPLPPAEWQPMDQVELERGESFQARSARSIAYWRSVLEDVPLDVFDHEPGAGEDPRFIEVGMESVALAAAAERRAQRWTISAPGVLPAACAAVLATVIGRRRAVMQLVHSNRRDPRTRPMIGTVGQDGLFVLDLPDADFAETCRTAHRNALTAYRNAHYDPFQMQAMRAEIGRIRGREPDLDAFLNDRRGGGDWPNLPEIAPGDDLTGLTAQTRTYVTNAWPGVRFKAFFTVGTAADTGQLSLIIDTTYLSRDTARAMLLGIEALLVRAVNGPVPMSAIEEVCGVAPYAPDAMTAP